MYVAVKGGEKAIKNAHALLREKRRGNPQGRELELEQLIEQLGLAVDRVMAEGSLYDPTLAALALKQAMGDSVEAIFILRAYRTTLPRFGQSEPIDTDSMLIQRRISATYKDIPGGQLLGPTFDYTHRLLDFSLAKPSEPESTQSQANEPKAGYQLASEPHPTPHVADILIAEDLIESAPTKHEPGVDITRESIAYPAARATRLQALSRADEGYLTALGYSTQRGYGRNHPFVGEIRIGEIDIIFKPDELEFEVTLGRLVITECDIVTQFSPTGSDQKNRFTRGYGLVFGHSERKAMAMAQVDRALRAEELDETISSPAQDQEFVLAHADNVEAVGFVSHLKLPHYVDFQSELNLLRKIRKESEDASGRI